MRRNLSLRIAYVYCLWRRLRKYHSNRCYYSSADIIVGSFLFFYVGNTSFGACTAGNHRTSFSLRKLHLLLMPSRNSFARIDGLFEQNYLRDFGYFIYWTYILDISLFLTFARPDPSKLKNGYVQWQSKVVGIFSALLFTGFCITKRSLFGPEIPNVSS